MDYQEVFQNMDRLDGVVIFCGDEQYVRASAVAALRAHLLPEGLESMNETVFDGPAEFSRFVESCETLPFMAEKRLVYWKNCPLIAPPSARGEEKKPAAQWQQYILETPGQTVVLLETQGKPDGRSQLVKSVSAKDRLVDFPFLAPAQLEKWAAQYVRRAGKTLQPGCAGALSQMVGPALTGIVAELEKAIGYCGTRGQITLDDVQAVTTPSLEFRGYQIGDFILQGDSAQALESIKSLLMQGTDAVALLAAITATFRQLLLTKSLLSGGANAAQIGQKLEIRYSFVVNKNISRARSLPILALKGALEACQNADYRIKSGQIAAEKALYLAVFETMAVIRPS